MNALADFLSHEAGQRRRNWLDSQSARAENALSYYLGPTGIDQKLNALAQALWLSDAGDVAEAADASQALWNDPSMANAGRYATAAAAMMVPAVSARMANAGGDVLGDALASGADDVRRFAADEYGGVRVHYGGPDDFDEFRNDYDFLGFRTVEGEHDPTLPSRVWSDGEAVDDYLDGTSATDVNFGPAAGMHKLAPTDWRHGYYPGDRTFLLGSNIADRGEDAGEIVMKEPVVLAEIVRKYGVAGAAAALGVSAGEVRAAIEGDDRQRRANEIEQYLAGLKP